MARGAFEYTRPDAASGRPLDWRRERWTAFLILSAGGTQSDAAAACGVKRGAVAIWLREWRDRWGDDIVVSRRPKVADIEQSRRSLLWNAGDNALKGTRIINQWLERYEGSDTLISILDTADLERLSRVVKQQAETFAVLAEVLGEVPRAGKPDLPVENVIQALEPGEDEEIDGIMAGLDEAERHLRAVGNDGEDVITVDHRLVS